MGCNCNKSNPARLLAGAAKLVRSELGIVVLKDQAVIDARRRACEGCDRWDHGKCLECGCYTYAKSRLTKETCPLDRWPELPALASD
ncbi:MAG: DUF6171 family protein [Synechococcus sp.]|nr:DUF6171 family protein [Synechococcus sp.]